VCEASSPTRINQREAGLRVRLLCAGELSPPTSPPRVGVDDRIRAAVPPIPRGLNMWNSSLGTPHEDDPHAISSCALENSRSLL